MPKGWTFMFLEVHSQFPCLRMGQNIRYKNWPKTLFFGHFWPFLDDKICTKAPFNPKIGGFMRIHMLYDCSQIMSHKSCDKN